MHGALDAEKVSHQACIEAVSLQKALLGLITAAHLNLAAQLDDDAHSRHSTVRKLLEVALCAHPVVGEEQIPEGKVACCKEPRDLQNSVDL